MLVHHRVFQLLVCGMVAACSGGGGTTPSAPTQPTSPGTSNTAPQISGTPATSATVNTAYSFQPSAADAEGDTLKFSITNLPGWATFSDTTGRLSGTPSNTGVTSGIVISVNDGKVSTALPAFSITVSAGSQANLAPTISGTPTNSVSVGETYSFQPTASDPDGNALGFTITNKPAWAQFSTSTGLLSGTPTSADVGPTSDIVISVNDGKLAAALAAFQITVAVAGTPSGGTDYHVGPGQAYTNVGDVPWYQLAGGDTVYIHHRSTPYREKILITSRGTAQKWVRVLGVPGPNGELPIISGDNATTSSNMRYRASWQSPQLIQWGGVIQIAVGDGASPVPGYIEIANLQVQDGFSTYRFTAQNGTTANYDGFAACIYSRSGQHILIRNNVLTNCGQGFYNWTGDGSSTEWWGALATDTVVRGNYFYDNGNPGSWTEHQIYTESDGVIIEQNRFGKQRTGAWGSQIKDRSVGTVIRYNYIDQAAVGWTFDLVEPEESYGAVGSKATYKQAFVYGNIVVNSASAGNGLVAEPNLVHWNEDHQQGSRGRAKIAGGKLFFYNNTLVTIANRSDIDTFHMFNVTYGGYECQSGSLPGIIDVRNNIIALLPRTSGSTVPQLKFGYCGQENFNFGKNWVSPGYSMYQRSGPGTQTGTANIVSPAGNDPGFVNVAGNDFHLTATSSAAGIASALAPELTSNELGLDLTPNQQYRGPQSVEARSATGLGSDAGALGR